jgi:hypothetical protein
MMKISHSGIQETGISRRGNDVDYQLVIAIGALLVSMLVAFSRTMDKSLSIREHEEFSKNTKEQIERLRQDAIRDTQGIKTDFNRDVDRIEKRLDYIEQTRPTTGELEARLDKKP